MKLANNPLMTTNAAWRKNAELRKQYLKEKAKEAGYEARQLARLCEMSLRQLERDCVADYGCELRVWLKILRMAAAPDLLREHGQIGKVARLLNYSHPTNFARDFKEVWGVTPSEFIANS